MGRNVENMTGRKQNLTYTVLENGMRFPGPGGFLFLDFLFILIIEELFDYIGDGNNLE